MAIGDRYATAEEYREIVGATDESRDATVVEPLLDAATDLLAQETGRFYTKDASVQTRTFDGNGLSALYIDDIATLSGLVVKCDLNGDYDVADANETLTINTHFWVAPANAGLGPEPEPWHILELAPNNALLSVWPRQARAVQVTAQFGWPAVPAAIKQATIMIARELQDLQKAGPSLELQEAGELSRRLSPEAYSVLKRIKSQYGKRAILV